MRPRWGWSRTPVISLGRRPTTPTSSTWWHTAFHSHPRSGGHNTHIFGPSLLIRTNGASLRDDRVACLSYLARVVSLPGNKTATDANPRRRGIHSPPTLLIDFGD